MLTTYVWRQSMISTIRLGPLLNQQAVVVTRSGLSKQKRSHILSECYAQTVPVLLHLSTK